MKKISTDMWLGFVGAVLGIVSLIVYQMAIGTSQGYFDETYSGTVIALCILGAVFACVSAAIPLKGSSKVHEVVRTILNVAACLCFGYVVGCIVFAISYEFAYTYFSDFNVGTVKETFIPGALTQAIISVVLTFLAMIVTAIAPAFKK